MDQWRKVRSKCLVLVGDFKDYVTNGSDLLSFPTILCILSATEMISCKESKLVGGGSMFKLT